VANLSPVLLAERWLNVHLTYDDVMNDLDIHKDDFLFVEKEAKVFQ
jgi:hypothetical protein